MLPHSLVSLNIRSCPCSDIDDALKAVAKLPKLRALALHTILLTDAGIAHLRALNLDSLELGFCPLVEGDTLHLLNVRELSFTAVLDGFQHGEAPEAAHVDWTFRGIPI